MDDECLYAGIQNTDTGLATTVNCPLCPVTDDTEGTVPKMWPDPAGVFLPRPGLRPHRETKPLFFCRLIYCLTA